ncbi:MAG: ImmA/IrrE family metallo-endopeptidase [Leuconostoc mesenteroides]|uniref:ImmA/IrrE family metallo-endopeptidase n=1 Tax=Leuconostoc mesenteroides TaxID=1245 RepID=UPI0032DED4D4
MTNVEFYIDRFPDYTFFGIEVPHHWYYGEVNKVGNEVIIFVNILQPEWQQIDTIVHEAGHALFNMYGDDKRWSMKTMLAEKQAEYVSNHFNI